MCVCVCVASRETNGIRFCPRRLQRQSERAFFNAVAWRARLAFFIRAAALQIRFGAKLIPDAMPKSRLHLFLELV